MFIARGIESKARALAAAFPSVIITGGRQAGKTTLARKIFPAYAYVSLDLPSLAERAERDPERFFADTPPPVVVDEVQHAPGLFRHIKRLVDERRNEKGLVVLIGSQKFVVMKQVSDSLAGRAVPLDLENLSFEDVRAAGCVGAGRAPLLDAIARGFYPELWKEPDLPSEDFYPGYLATYLERDVRQILDVTNLRDFERFLRLLAVRSATQLNKTEIVGDVGVSPKTIGEWLSVLEASGVVSFLEPWFASFGKRIVKTPKVYFNDTGLLCYLLALRGSEIERSAFTGRIWETFVFSEIRKRNQLRTPSLNLWYYRDQRAREVDFLFESGGQIDCLECTWSENPRSEDARTMKIVLEELAASSAPWRSGRAGIVCPAVAPHRLSDGTTVISPEGILAQYP